MDVNRVPRSGPELVDLMRELAADFRRDPGSWEVQTVDAYLEAMAQWMDDTEGLWEEVDFAELAGLIAIGRHRDR